MKAKILLVEDDEIMRITLYDRLLKEGWQVDEAMDGKAALELIEYKHYHLVLSDIRMPGMSGTRLLKEIVSQAPETDIIMMTAYGSVADAIDCLRKGAADYILKPFDLDDLTIRIKRLFERRVIKSRCVSLEECCRHAHPPLIGSSAAHRHLLNLIGQVAVTDATVLITGASGTGKELVAAAIHHGSKRAGHTYVRVNCAAIPENLMESELFGHEKGAFTGAVARKIGRFELADGGTLLLDEIGELPLHLQAKLLRVLQEKEIERVGGTRTIRVDVRIICATARNLEQEVEAGRFRGDLLYRLKVIPIEVPPLREHKDDIPELSRFFLGEFSKDRGIFFQLAEESLGALMHYDYPGNVRELKNILERATVLSPAPLIQPWNLPAELTALASQPGETSFELAVKVAETERSAITRALRHTAGNKTEAARLLGISRKCLWEKAKQLQISSE
jgi:two-component system, NtrC family, response regulator AtoC